MNGVGLIGAIVIGILWAQMFDPSSGLLNGILTAMGFDFFKSFAWLGDERTASRIVDAIGKGRFDKQIAPEEIKAALSAEVERVLAPVAKPLVIDAAQKPFVILMVGVNGSGKTTTIGKLAAKFRAMGKSVMLAAGDTFRAAAIEQLKVWSERTGAAFVARDQGADAAGLAFDALTEARANGTVEMIRHDGEIDA